MRKISPAAFKSVLEEAAASRVLASIAIPTPTNESLDDKTILEVWVSKLAHPVALELFTRFDSDDVAEKEQASNEVLSSHFFETKDASECWLTPDEVEKMPYTYKALLVTAFIEAQNPTKKILALRTSSGAS